MRSLKTKLVITICLLIIVLFGLTAYLFVREKSRELTGDIFANSRSFAELTAGKVVNDYNLYLAQNSFIYFNREIQDVFNKFADLDGLKIVNYEGAVVYDSKSDQEKQYQGEPRKVDDKLLLDQIQSRNPSILTLDTKRVVYLKKTQNGQFDTVDFNEKPLQPLAKDEKIYYLVQPASNDFALIYYISYKNLQQRINETALRGFLLAIFGVGVGVLLAFLYAGSITKPLKKLTDGAGIIATGDFKHRVEVKTRDELFTLANAFNKMAEELDVSTKALVYKERVAKELELAAKIQKELLPKVVPQINGIDIAAGLLPAEEIGGDCYDFLRKDDNNLLMYLGDVTGHGVPSGIVVSIANALIYNYSTETDIKQILLKVNRILKDKTTSNMFMTLVMLTWNVLEQKIKFVSAGHEQMVYFHAADKKVTLTPSGGLALGMLADIEKTLQEHELMMEKGDTLIVYSDGIPECWRNEKEMYGISNLKRAASEYSGLPTALEIRDAILADVKQFAAGYKQMDDITLIVIKKI